MPHDLTPRAGPELPWTGVRPGYGRVHLLPISGIAKGFQLFDDLGNVGHRSLAFENCSPSILYLGIVGAGLALCASLE